MENCLLLQCSLGVSRALCGLHQWERGESCRGSSPPALRADGPGPAVPAATAPPSEPRAALRGPPAAPPASSSGRGAPSLSPRGSAASAPPPGLLPASARRFRRGPCRGGSVRRWPGGGGARSGSSRSTSCRTSPSRCSSTCSRCCPPQASTRAA